MKRARLYNPEEVEYWQGVLKLYDDWFQVSGYAHPKVIVYKNEEPDKPNAHTWGLVPKWAKNPGSIWNNTLNAKSETMFKLPSFAESAEKKRCVIPADGFYEHHHFRKNAYPFYIRHKEGKPFYFAGLWNDWIDPTTGEVLPTFTIVTTRANGLMAKIHNEPKASDEPRMPVILPEDVIDDYLKLISPKEVMELCVPFPEEKMEAYTVRKLSGKNSLGNVPDANKKFDYPELEIDGLNNNQFKLF